MRLIKPDTKINFLGQRYIAFVVSIVMVVIAIGSIATQGLALDVDFTGGVIVEVSYPDAANLGDVRTTLADHGYPDATVQLFGSTRDVMIRLGPQETKDAAAVSNNIMSALQAAVPDVALQRVEFVGSQVGSELVSKGSLALLYTIIGILIYVMIRFHWKLAAGAVVALAHDVIVVTGIFSLFHLDFDLTVLAALMAILGFSVNDTVVVFDRQRENFRRMRKADTFKVMNVSINETLARTVMTSLTVFLADLALLVFGGDSVRGFALAMMIGTIVGTYSSVYIASAIGLHLGVIKEDIYPPKEEDAERHTHVTH